MPQPVSLLFGVHAHQPVGNFREVLDDAHWRCYRPFLQLLERFPDFHFSLHISGWLLDDLLTRYPDDIALLKTMVARGQVELFCAGYTEPVLAAIPVRDRIGQVNLMSARFEQVFGQRPSGAWLTERVWDSGVVPSLVACGVRYVTVDDYHFLCAGKREDELSGYFSTEEDGRRLDIFPISEALRYRLPFSPAIDAVRYLESLAGEGEGRAAVYFDDIEKFGIWPETYDWVYTRGWLEEFVQRVLDSPLVRPQRYSDYHAAYRTRGVVYLPTTSYIEMNEWTLPAEASAIYAGLVEEARQTGHYDKGKPFLRGGIWRNFLSRYPESNWMHKRMLSLSARFSSLSDARRTLDMRNALYEAQANDAYWHGLFGGLYLPHLRRAVYSALIRLEGMLDKASHRPEFECVDLDLDGHPEYFVQNGVLQAVVCSDGRADIRELDHYRLGHNFGDTLMRQREHYHHKVILNRETAHEGEGISNPHDRVSFKQVIGPEDLVFDPFPRSLFIDRIVLGDESRVVRYEGQAAPDAGPSLQFKAVEGGGLVKRIGLDGENLNVTYEFAELPAGDFEVELNLAMPSCDGPAGRFEMQGEILGGFGQPQESDLTEIVLRDEVLGGTLRLSANQPGRWRSAPCFSVSQSEAGFEKIMQAVTLHLRWPCERLASPLVIRLWMG
ncbi:MAG: DUF1926 domain-containing protein [Betaproteobacteria bacterium]|nr:DUF1926 domain-containing protein [Betaproteobacteria bacterium]